VGLKCRGGAATLCHRRFSVWNSRIDQCVTGWWRDGRGALAPQYRRNHSARRRWHTPGRWTLMTTAMMMMMMTGRMRLLLPSVRNRHLCRICVRAGRGQLDDDDDALCRTWSIPVGRWHWPVVDRRWPETVDERSPPLMRSTAAVRRKTSAERFARTSRAGGRVVAQSVMSSRFAAVASLCLVSSE